MTKEERIKLCMKKVIMQYNDLIGNNEITEESVDSMLEEDILDGYEVIFTMQYMMVKVFESIQEGTVKEFVASDYYDAEWSNAQQEFSDILRGREATPEEAKRS